MPSKSQRAAARQAKLRENKKKRGRANSQTFDPGPVKSSRENIKSNALTNETPVAPQRTHDAPRVGNTSEITAKSASSNEALNYGYLRGELGRIFVLTCLVVVILSVLTFVIDV